MKRNSAPPGEHCNALPFFKDMHQGETIIVCGCGESINEFPHPEQYVTIGVNDLGRRFHPDYLVVVNTRSQFSRERFRYIETSKAKYLFTQLDLGLPGNNIVRFRLGKRGGTDFSDPNILHYTQNSPYVALCLAVHMGAKRIGLIGVDFTDNHFFAKTGRHMLSPQLPRINAEYKALGEALSRRGIEVINLSRKSRITAFKKGDPESFHTQDYGIKKEEKRPSGTEEKKPSMGEGYRLFFVHYHFLSCGDVFREGLNHAASDLGVGFSGTYWDDPGLPRKVGEFGPDLVFVVHGRNFSRKWAGRYKDYNKAVWLLDEPYEVDDTSRFSGGFDWVFVNDPGTIHRHKNAYYLPVCFDPKIYFPVSGQNKRYDVGFIGGYNPVRQNMLEMLHKKGLLSYIVGGPWKGAGLNRVCISSNIPATETAGLYKQTKIVINIFRKVHHFNKQRIPAVSLNPRVYEALASGALVVSENRPEIKEIFPRLPVFEDGAQLVEIVEGLLSDRERYEDIRRDCYERLKGHTYIERLKKIIHIVRGEGPQTAHQSGPFENRAERIMIQYHPPKGKYVNAQSGHFENRSYQGEKVKKGVLEREGNNVFYEDWEGYGDLVERDENGILVLRKANDPGPGTERGLVSRRSYSDAELSFECNIKRGSCFVVKVCQEDKFNQQTNSYHLMCNDKRDYFARHFYVFRRLDICRDSWESIRIKVKNGAIFFYKNDNHLFSLEDRQLKGGYAFIGIKGGEVHLRNIFITDIDLEKGGANDDSTRTHIDYEILKDSGRSDNRPVVSIITTVYNRAECLRACIRSVKNLTFKDYEHIIVADSPPGAVLKRLKDVIDQEDCGKIKFVNLKNRFNNWGIAPASVGMRLSKGDYVCFLSDDNGYTPDHVGNLVEALKSDPALGFVYSSCLYDGRMLFNSPVPCPGRIDLGQPMFKRELFKLHLNDTIPFNTLAWDWEMINRFMKKGVKWRHVNKPSFLFRLAKYPEFRISKNRADPLVSISVLCHNNFKYTARCIQSILTETRPEFELLIMDNCSSDNTRKYLRSIKDPRVRIYLNDKNKGFIMAHNAILEKARGVYFVVLNNDLTVKGEWLERIMDGFDEPGVKIVGPVACRLDSDGRGYEVAGGEYDYIEGCCLAIETSFAKQIGLFSSEFEFMYCEDSDLSLRVRAMGYKIKKVDCNIRHTKAATTNRCNSPDIHGYRIKNHYILRKKWKEYLEKRSYEKRLFIKRTGAIGDVFLLSAIIEYLKTRNVYLKINIITKCPQLLNGNPLIEKIWMSPPGDTEFSDLDGAYERRPYMHIVDAYAQELGIKGEINRQPRIYLNEDENRWAKEHCNGEYIVIHAGPTDWPGRQIPVGTFARSAEILKKRGHTVVEIGTVRNLPNADKDFTGLSWKQTACVIRNSTAFIGIDSAPMHIAQAFDKPGAVIFGCIDPKYRLVHPEKLRPVVADVGCKFCHHWRSAPRIYSDCLREDPACMKMITPDQILEEFDKAMELVPII